MLIAPPTPSRLVQRLPHASTDAIRSTSILASFSAIVEELVMNAIDAKASTIEVYVDFKAYIIKVVDDGVGISREDLETKIGQFGCTNKSVNGDTYGCKGEALAAISRLATLEIRSKLPNSDKSNRIIIGNVSSTSSDFGHSSASKGETSVVVSDIFTHFPVRRKALRANVEIHRVREMVKRYSICHKQIRFSLYDFGQQRLLLTTPPCESVLDRLEAYHDPRLVRALEFVDAGSVATDLMNRNRVTGWISVPQSDMCFSSKECQYLFINNRWFRNSEFLVDLINYAFRKFVCLEFEINGLNSIEFQSSKRFKRLFPGFVLNFEIPKGDIDALVDPDKSTLLFRNVGTINDLLIEVLRGLFEKHLPSSLIPLMAVLDQARQATSGMVVSRKRFRCTETRQGASKSTAPLVLLHSKSLPLIKNGNVSKVNFEDAFGCAELPILSKIDEGSDAARETRSTIPPPVSQFGVVVSREPDSLVNRYDGALCSHFLLDAEPCAPKSYLGHDLNENPAFNIPASGPSVDECFDPSHAAAADLRPMPQSCEESNVDSDAIVTMSQCSEPAAWLDLDQDFRITTFSASNPASPPIKRRSDLHSSSIVDVRPTKRTLKRYLPDKAVIKRSHLTLCTPIGQFDNKIIIVKSKGILIAIDQHAADERVRLENLTEAVHEALETFPQREKSGLLEQTKLVDFVSLLLESTDAFVISAHLTLLHKWGFLCKVTNTRVDRNSCTCTIQAVPTVLSETLTRDDFIEYVAFLKQQESSVEDDVRYPEEGGRISVISIARRLRPPAVTRILASKACRGAIMFGDRLNEEDVLRLVKGLSSCNLPFQCAHGRPSVYPIADIRQLPRTNSEYYNHSVNVGRKLLFDLETRSSNIEEGADGGR